MVDVGHIAHVVATHDVEEALHVLRQRRRILSVVGKYCQVDLKQGERQAKRPKGQEPGVRPSRLRSRRWRRRRVVGAETRPDHSVDAAGGQDQRVVAAILAEGEDTAWIPATGHGRESLPEHLMLVGICTEA